MNGGPPWAWAIWQTIHIVGGTRRRAKSEFHSRPTGHSSNAARESFGCSTTAHVYSISLDACARYDRTYERWPRHVWDGLLLIGSKMGSNAYTHRERIFWYERFSTCFVWNLHHRRERGEKGGSAKFKTKHTEPFIPEYSALVYINQIFCHCHRHVLPFFKLQKTSWVALS